MPSDREFFTAPALAPDGNLFVVGGLQTAGFYSPDGALLWRREVGRAGFLDPVITGDGTILLGRSEKGLLALRSDGSEAWESPALTRAGHFGVSPTGLLVFASGNESLVAVDSAGHLLWRVPAAAGRDSRPVAAPDGTLYAILSKTNQVLSPSLERSRRYLYALAPDGAMRWRTPCDWGPLVVAANGTLFGLLETNVTAYGPGGKVLWRFDPQDEGASQSPSGFSLGLDGRLYVIASNTLFAIQTASGPANSWAMPRGSSRAASSAYRLVLPPLRALRTGNTVHVRFSADPSGAFTLLHSRDLNSWRIWHSSIADPLATSWELAVEPGSARWTRSCKWNFAAALPARLPATFHHSLRL